MAPVKPNEIVPSGTTNRQQVALSWLLALVAAGLFAWRFPGIAQGAVSFVITLGILVLVHEYGHFQCARLAGMKVNRFGIGFPPWIYTRNYKGIDYSLGALPIGGMVDIAGLGSEEDLLGGNPKGAALAPGNANIPHGSRLFQDAPLGWRFATLFAGPFMNLVLATVVFVVFFAVVGIPVPKGLPEIEAVIADRPAKAAGIQPGDRLVGVNQVRSDSADALAKAIQQSQGKSITVLVRRAGAVKSFHMVPIHEADGYKIGIQFKMKIQYHHLGLVQGVGSGFEATWEISYALVDFLRRLVTFQVHRQELREVGGPVAIAREVGQAAAESWKRVVIFGASLSINLAVLNLLPIPALDGGRIMFLCYELVFRRPVDPRKESWAHFGGIILLLLFMLAITAYDLFRLRG